MPAAGSRSLVLIGVCIHLQGRALFAPLNVTVHAGEVVTVMGPSGCGKSTLLAEPAALLLDEPFSKLDADLRGRIRTFVFEHARQRSLPTLLVTHDSADADAAKGPVIVLGANPAD